MFLRGLMKITLHHCALITDAAPARVLMRTRRLPAWTVRDGSVSCALLLWFNINPSRLSVDR